MLEIKNSEQVELSDRVRFRCKRCGECCRHVKNTVIIESLDAYNLAKHLNVRMDEIYLEYADSLFIEDTEYPVFALKTVGEKDSCVFLKGNRCTVQEAKPRTCRMYPFWVEPCEAEVGSFQYNFTSERPHHPKGSLVRVKDWMRDNFSDEYKAFLTEEWRAIKELAPAMKAAYAVFPDKADLLRLILMYRYFMFELDMPFLEQHKANNKTLLKIIEDRIRSIGSV